MNKEKLLDEYFIEARAHLLDLAAFLDRMERAEGLPDFRWSSLAASVRLLSDRHPEKTRRILECLSDPTDLPAEHAAGKSACGAWPGFNPPR